MRAVAHTRINEPSTIFPVSRGTTCVCGMTKPIHQQPRRDLPSSSEGGNIYRPNEKPFWGQGASFHKSVISKHHPVPS